METAFNNSFTNRRHIETTPAQIHGSLILVPSALAARENTQKKSGKKIKLTKNLQTVAVNKNIYVQKNSVCSRGKSEKSRWRKKKMREKLQQ